MLFFFANLIIIILLFKVWRGFNGNIYFEPIQYHHLQTVETSQQELPITQNSQRQLAITDNKKLSRAKTEGEILNNKLKHHQLSSRFSNTANLTTRNLPHVNIDDNLSNDEEFVFITQQPDTIEYPRNFTSISSFIQQNQIHSQQSVMTTPFGNHHQPMSNISEHQHQQQQLTVQPGSPKFSSNFLVKSRTTIHQNITKNSTKKEPIVIQPNPTAASLKSKGPLKGLAYKEVKQRIIDKLAPIYPLSYYTSNFDENFLDQLNKEEPVQYDTSQQTLKQDKKRLDYKNMLKKIRKGITSNTNSTSITSTQPQQQQQQQHPTEQIPTVKLARNDRTTSAYISGARNRIQPNSDLMLNSITSTSDPNGLGVSIEENFGKKKNKILQVKGDRISIDLFINESTFNTPLTRHKSSIILGSARSTTRGVHGSDEATTSVDTYNSLRNVRLKNNTRLKSASLKSLTSSCSIFGLHGKRINPTPEFDNNFNLFDNNSSTIPFLLNSKTNLN